ncbi:hypothetical protein, partial [Rikenella microfusus]|uniref:hypothetical protein n=1 Tax=Rikenella microfusus TaxID=28139 RepID=UPI003AB17B29
EEKHASPARFFLPVGPLRKIDAATAGTNRSGSCFFMSPAFVRLFIRQKRRPRECAISRSDWSRERGIEFPATFCLLFWSRKKESASAA